MRKFFFKNWNDVSVAMQDIEARLSKMQGVHGQFDPKRTVDAGNVSSVSNLTAPTKEKDAARYSDAMRSKSYSFSIGGSATGTTYNLLRLADGINYYWGGGYNYCYTAPCDLEFYKLSLFGGQVPAPGMGGGWMMASVYGAGTILTSQARIASITMWSRNFPVGTYFGTVTKIGRAHV